MWPTDQPTNRPTDRQSKTDKAGCRVACMRLNICRFLVACYMTLHPALSVGWSVCWSHFFYDFSPLTLLPSSLIVVKVFHFTLHSKDSVSLHLLIFVCKEDASSGLVMIKTISSYSYNLIWHRRDFTAHSDMKSTS